MLLAIAAEFRPIDAAAVSDALDELARMLRDGEGAGACHAARLRGRIPVGRHV